VGGIPLQIIDGEGGYLVSSPEEAARRSIEVLSDPELAKQLGRAGKERVRSQFLTPRLLRDWLRLLGGADATDPHSPAAAVRGTDDG
jgi:trehalose synthase